MTSSSPTSEGPWSIYAFEPIDSRTYVLVEETEALVVDPMAHPGMLEALTSRGVSRATVLLTHEHYDHCGGVNWLREQLSIQVIASEACAENLQRPTINGSRYFEALFALHDQAVRDQVRALGVEPYTTTADTTFSGSIDFDWCGHRISITEAPGHTPGSVLIDIDERWLFTGDSWIPGKPTITRLPGGSPARFAAVTRPQLDALLGVRTVLPGHHDPTHAPAPTAAR